MFERGEEVITSLQDFCEQEQILGAHFTALGAVENARLGFYDLSTKEYVEKNFTEAHELASCVGNVSRKPDGALFAHTHAVLSNREMQTVAGHVFAMDVAVTVELSLRILTAPLNREHEEDVGLDLLTDGSDV